MRTADSQTLVTGHTVHVTIDRQGRPAVCRSASRGSSHEGTCYRCGRLHRIDALGTASCRRCRGRRTRLLYGLLPSTNEGAQPRGPLEKPSVRVRRVDDSGRGLKGILAARTHVFHLAAQAGVRKSWGRDFAVYTVNNIEATQVLLEAVAARETSSGSFMRPVRRSTAISSRCRCVKMRCRSRSPHMA